MKWCKISPPLKTPKSVEIDLPLSKSIYNRLLIMRALSKNAFSLSRGPLALDSVELKEALSSYHAGARVINSGEGGSSFRFLLAFLACEGFEGTLVASGTMISRPIAPLVDALNVIGVNLSLRKSELQLAVDFRRGKIHGGDVQIDASISSQFITALIMIGPYLPKGINIHRSLPSVSTSYIAMTVKLMKKLGAQIHVSDAVITVQPGAYTWSSSSSFQVERDWSAASYFWMHRFALSVENLFLGGLHENSLQGDAIISKWDVELGGTSYFDSSGWVLGPVEKTESYFGRHFNGLDHPDLAMTHISLYAFLGYPLIYTGLSTLADKESHRLRALQMEWAKVGVKMQYEPPGKVFLKSSVRSAETAKNDSLLIHTHGDHRIAMCLSILAASRPVWIENPNVVSKSFPNYWAELSKLGYRIEVNTSPKF